jgi:ubiquinone biosynthesis protein
MKRVIVFIWEVVLTGFRMLEMIVILAGCFLRYCSYRFFSRTWKTRSEEIWADLLEKLGPTYIKIGQIAAMRRDLLPVEIAQSLSRLQDRLRPMKFNWILKTLQKSFESVDGVFSTIDPVPVASASISQVHRGVLRATGQIVAIKIRRPGLERVVKCDLLVMTVLGKLGKLKENMRNMPLQETVDDLFKIIFEQLDFVTEVENNKRLQAIFENDPAIRIPKVIEELCTAEVIVMEYMEGTMRIESPALGVLQQKKAIDTGLHALYRMIFTFGFFHCDLHMGNLFVNGKGELVILDTGFMGRLRKKELETFKAFFLSIVANDGRRCSNILIETAIRKSHDFDRQGFEDRVRALIAETSGKRAVLFEVSQFSLGLFETMRKFGLKGSVDFNMAILSLLVYEGLIKTFYPELDFQRAAIPYITEAFIYV